MSLLLSFEIANGVMVDARSLQPESLARMSKAELERLPLEAGNRMIPLGEICRIKRRSHRVDELTFEGSTHRLVNAGWGMSGGKLVIDGDAGYGTGMEMTAGEIHVLGRAGDCLGAGMQGGLIRIQGDAGDYCGASQFAETAGIHSMNGGTVLVEGSAGRELGSGMRRGLICVYGDAGEFAGARMQAGTIVICGKAAKGAGIGMRRGSLLSGKHDALLPGFDSSGPADVEWLRIYFIYLMKVGFSIPQGWQGHLPQRFTGDTLELGKGEIILYDFAE